MNLRTLVISVSAVPAAFGLAQVSGCAPKPPAQIVCESLGGFYGSGSGFCTNETPRGARSVAQLKNCSLALRSVHGGTDRYAYLTCQEFNQ